MPVPRPDLISDPRWRAFTGIGFDCGACGARHQGIFDLAQPKPHYWEAGEGREGCGATATHFLSDDFCAINGEHHFVRCILELPIRDSDGAYFAYGVWSSLAAANFALYRDSFASDAQAHLGPWFGWFSNALKGYPDTLSLKCRVRPRDGGQRPALELEPTDHPLAIEQRDGITFDRLLEIYALNGHDLRPHLGGA